MTEQDKAIRQMNEWGRKGTPFFFLIDFDQQKPVVLPLEEVEKAGICFSTPYYFADNETETSSTAILEHEGYSLSSYTSQFQNVVDHIRAGDSFLVNLTCQTPVRLHLPFDQLYKVVRAKYKLLYKSQFLVFSPETFVQIQDGVISSCPMPSNCSQTIPRKKRNTAPSSI